VTDPDDAFAILGLEPTATVVEVRAARRELARRHHPDQGGDAAVMQVVNDAADRALTHLQAQRATSDGSPASAPTRPDPAPSRPGPVDDHWSGAMRDMPSFTVEALPVETFEGLLIAASWIGEVLDDDPPYRLEVHLHAPLGCWCRLDVVPDAGASTVSLTVAGVDDAPPPDVVAVRDLWVTSLNEVDWD